jgi:hypothetical protein
MIEWDNVKDNNDLKTVIMAVHGTLGFSKDNMFYEELKKKGLLGDEQTVDVPEQPVPVPVVPEEKEEKKMKEN